MTSLKYSVCDAFTKEPFKGNPAAVIVLKDPLSDDMYQKIAREFNLSETVFVIKNLNEVDQFSLRWFSPTVEVGMCGHATLAASHELFRQGLIEKDEITFETLAGILKVKKDQKTGFVKMLFPKGNPVPCKLPDDVLKKMLKNLNLEDDLSVIEQVCLCNKTKKLLVHFKTLETILQISPNGEGLLQMQWGSDLVTPLVRGIIATTPWQSKYQTLLGLHSGDYDFTSRYFTPWHGILEDQVNGSGHTVQSVYYAKLFQKNNLKAWQASARGGELHLEVLDHGKVSLGGFGCTVIEGTVFLQERNDCMSYVE